jgi:hypothetical protein
MEKVLWMPKYAPWSLLYRHLCCTEVVKRDLLYTLSCIYVAVKDAHIRIYIQYLSHSVTSWCADVFTLYWWQVSKSVEC